ncbi:hypothetical protein [Kribbella sp. NPDC048928]|uniref:hypothetical protein n=1 Tax=Kribbella sp. NPDC048928 TaxID=3364111 RepID=UPI0037129FD9
MMYEIDRYWLEDGSAPSAPFATFRGELIQLLEGNREGLYPQAIGLAAEYDQRSDDEFLRWLWDALYPGEVAPRQRERLAFGSYWLEDKSLPFATFLAVIQTHYHPEVRNDNFEELVEMARAGRGGDRMVIFKDELSRLVRGDREGLRPGAIDTATAYDDWKTDDEFLAWLWKELYPGEPLPRSVDNGRGQEFGE